MPGTNGAAIVAEGLHKSFGRVRALEGIDLSVPAGTVLGLLGPNGAGKTTAVRILTTLLSPDAGRAEVLGYDVIRDADRLREVIGLAGQNAAVDENLTGRENLLLVGRLYHLPKSERHARADEILERFDLADAADRTVKTYSGGMRRRLDLGASLVGRPQVLFLDEPTTGLDPRGRLALWEVIEQLVGGGTTLLLTTQYLEEADRLADAIAVIDGGRIIAEGTADELKMRVGGEVLEFRVSDRTQLPVVAGELISVGSGAPQIDNETGQILLPVGSDGSGVLTDVVRRLDSADVRFADLALRRPTLDDVFMTLTGRMAESAEETDGDGTGPRRERRRQRSLRTVNAPATRAPMRWVVADAMAMTWRNLIKYVRVPTLLVFSTIQPVMFVLLFAFVFGGAIPIPGVDYKDFLMPGIFVQTVVFGSTQTGVGLADDLSRGMVDRFRSLPMARSAVLAGRTISDTVRNAFVVLLMTGVGYAIGFRFHGGLPASVAAILLAIGVGAAFSWISANIGLAIRDVEATQAASFVWIFPFVFASAAFVPIQSMPGWLQSWAEINPISIWVNAVRSLTLGEPTATLVVGGSTQTHVLQSLAWIASILLVFVPLAVRRYRKT